MQSKPRCPTTHQPTTIFCLSTKCQQPAFGCSKACLSEHKHGLAQREMDWSSIQGELWNVINRGPSEQELEILKAQQKAILVLIDDLRQLHQNHTKSISQQRKNLQLKQAVQKVITAIETKNTDRILGKDMAQLVRMLENDDKYGNTAGVQDKIKLQTKMVNKIIEEVQNVLKEGRGQIAALKNSKSADLVKNFAQIQPEIDTAKFDGLVTIKQGVVSVNTASSRVEYPIYLKQKLENGQSFKVNIVENGVHRYFRIGVGIAGLQPTPQGKYSQSKRNCMCVGATGQLQVDGKVQKLIFSLNMGDTVTVRRRQQSIEWLKNEQQICQAAIPGHMTSQPLFPLCWILNYSDAQFISKLRFI